MEKIDVKRRYGQWAGNSRGNAYRSEQCYQEVYPQGRSMIPYQCRRPAGYGPNKAYCKQHAKEHEGK